MTVDPQDAKVAELRQAIREANEVLKDLRAERKAIADEFARRAETIGQEVGDRIESAVAKGLGEYSSSLDTAIEEATQAVYDRFDLIAAICLGEDYESKRAGSKPIDELIRRYIKVHGIPV